MYTREFQTPVKTLVENGRFHYGSFDTPFEHANILDVSRPYHYPIPRILKNLRVNESQTFQFGDKNLFAYIDLYNAKLFTLVFCNFYDRLEKRRFSYWSFLPGSYIDFPDSLYSSKTYFRDRHFDIKVKADLAQRKIFLDGCIRHFSDRPDAAFSFSFEHNAEKSRPLVSSIPFGLNRAVYSYKAPAPATGILRLGEKEFTLEPGSAIGMFTDQKGFYPYITSIDWVTGMGFDSKGRSVSFNLLDNHIPNQDQYNENALWLGDELIPLPSIKITRPQGPEGDWNLQDMEGMVDLIFHPEVKNSMHINAIFAESDYHGPFGSFEGCFRTPKGEKILTENLFGMGKKKRLRA